MNKPVLEASNHPFTFAEYKEFVIGYYKHQTEQWEALQKFQKKGPHDFFVEKRIDIDTYYRLRLPTYLLARCPICGGTVTERVDTFSLNGPGWRPHSRGYGWYGEIARQDPVTRRVWEKPAYHADCEHLKIIEWYVNLNGLEPTDVTMQPVYIYDEIPHLLAVPMQAEGVVAVMHTIPIGRFDDPEPTPRYTAYFTSYFTKDDAAYEQAMQKVYEYGEGSIAVMPYDYDFEKYLDANRLFWLDTTTAELAIRGGPISEFPYLNVVGRQGMSIMIANGTLEGLAADPNETFLRFVMRKLGIGQQGKR